MKSYTLTVDRLYILPSIKLAFHYIYFFAKRWVIFVWDLRRYVQFGVSVPISSTGSESPPLDITTLQLRLVRMTCKSVDPITTEVKILNVDRVSFESHQRCLLPSPKKCPFESVPRASKDSVGGGSGLPWCGGHWWRFWIYDLTPLRTRTQGVAYHFSLQFRKMLQPCPCSDSDTFPNHFGQ